MKLPTFADEKKAHFKNINGTYVAHTRSYRKRRLQLMQTTWI